MNFGFFPMVNHQSRLQRRFYEEVGPLEGARAVVGQSLDAQKALALGLVTAAPDDIDWTDEIRLAVEERAAMSPDSLTGLEANLRFCPKRKHGNTHLWPFVRLAKLDLQPPQRGWRKRCFEGLRQRRKVCVRFEPRLMF